MSQGSDRIRRELERRAREAADESDGEDDTGTGTSPVGGVAPPDDAGGDSEASDSDDEIDPGSSPAPPGGVAPPDDADEDSGTSDSDEIDPGSSPAPPGGVAPPDDTPDDSPDQTEDEIDPGSSPAPPGGVAPPDDAQGESPDQTEDEIDPGSSPAPPGGVAPPDDAQDESTDQTDDEFYDPTTTQTSPVGGEAPPESTYENVEGLSSSREADIRQNVADQYDNIFYNDISLRREELSDEEVNALRREAAQERNVSPDRIEFEQTPFRVVPDISEEGQERAAEVDIAEDYANVSPLEVDVTDMSGGEADVDILTEEAEAEVQTQRAMEAQESSGIEGEVWDDQQLAENQTLDEASDAIEGIDGENQVQGTDSFGQTTDPDFDPDAMPEGTIDYASEAIGLDIEEAASVTGETLVDRPVQSTETGFETIARGAGIDFNVVDAGEATGETLVNRPVESTETGFETIADEGGEGVDRTIEELEGGIGPGSAAVPAVVTGTGTGSVVSTGGTGAAAASAVVAVPAAAGALGVRGITQREDVTAPVPESEQGEVPVQEPTTDVEEIAVGDGTVQEQSEIDVTDASVEEQPEIVVEEDALEYTPEIEVDETTMDSENEIPVGSETDTAVDQPSGGFDDLPRDDYQEPDINEPIQSIEEEEMTEESITEEEEAGEIGEQFRQEQVSNIPLSEQQYLQEEIGRYEETTGGGYVFPGSEAEASETLSYEPELEYDADFDVGYTSETGSSMLMDTLPEFGAIPDATVATDIMTGTDVSMEEEAIMPSQTIPEMEYEYPTPNEPGYEYPYEYGYGSGGQSRNVRVPRLPSLPEQESEAVESDGDIDEMFGFDIDVGSYMDIL